MTESIRDTAQRVKERAETNAAKHTPYPDADVPFCSCMALLPCPERQAHLDTARDAQSILDALAKVQWHAEQTLSDLDSTRISYANAAVSGGIHAQTILALLGEPDAPHGGEQRLRSIHTLATEIRDDCAGMPGHTASRSFERANTILKLLGGDA